MRTGWRRTVAACGVAALIALAAVVVAIPLVANRGTGSRISAETAGGEQSGRASRPASADTVRPERTIRLPWPPTRVAAGAGHVWVIGGGRQLLRIDRRTNRIAGRAINLPERPTAVAADGAIAAAAGERFLVVVDARTGRVARTVRVPSFSLAASEGTLWTANLAEGPTFLHSFDPRSGELRRKRVKLDTEVLALAAGARSIWAISHDRRTLMRVPTERPRIAARERFRSEPHGVAFGSGFVWVADYHALSVTPVDPRSTRPRRPIRVGFPVEWLAADYGAAWVIPATGGSMANANDHRLVRIDARSHRTGNAVHLRGRPTGIATGFGSVWVATERPNALLRLNPADIARKGGPPVGN